MKRLNMIILSLWFLTLPFALPAQESQMPQTQGMGMMAPMRAQMNKMHAQMEAIRKTEDPQMREQMLNQHWQSMREAMGMMRGMHRGGAMGSMPPQGGMGQGSGMMGSGPGKGHMMQPGSGKMPDKSGKQVKPDLDQMWQQHQKMQAWMEGMEGLMEQMMEHQQQRQRHRAAPMR